MSRTNHFLTLCVKKLGAAYRLIVFVMFRQLLTIYHRWTMAVERPEIDYRLLLLFAGASLPSFSFWRFLSGAFQKRNWVWPFELSSIYISQELERLEYSISQPIALFIALAMP